MVRDTSSVSTSPVTAITANLNDSREIKEDVWMMQLLSSAANYRLTLPTDITYILLMFPNAF